VFAKPTRTTVALIAVYTAFALGAFWWLIRNDKPAKDPVSLVNQFVDIVQEGALQSERVDWPKTRVEALATLPRIPTEQDVYRAYRSVLYALKDPHTFHISRSDFERVNAPKSESAVATEFTELSEIATGIVQIKVRSYVSVNPEKFASDGLGALAEIEKRLPAVTCGVLIDLSENTGGNMFAMFIALMPFLGEGTLMTHADRHGKRHAFAWSESNSETNLMVDNVLHPVRKKEATLASWNTQVRRPIAVIQSGFTASSGEATLIGLRGLSHVKTFGTRTAGYATSNKLVSLNDGSALALTVARMADRNGNVFIDYVDPDIATGDSVAEARKEAISWLQKTCSKG
jgi:carboxyl-terminal processing protease